jgi:hypothetical protein
MRRPDLDRIACMSESAAREVRSCSPPYRDHHPTSSTVQLKDGTSLLWLEGRRPSLLGIRDRGKCRRRFATSCQTLAQPRSRDIQDAPRPNKRDAMSRVSKRKDLAMFRKIALGLALAGASALPLAGAAEAAVADGVVSAHIPSAQIAPVEKAQFVYGGRNYCWYGNGWHGPGWYWCGYGARVGFGWGGGYGWNGWRGGYGYHGGYYHGGYHGGYAYRGYHGGYHGYHGGVHVH